ncbi:hypothetical protein [Falsiroseomonas selenitidurans]|uniref:Lipoprotein n=1 Tax=Falsiroseomonas selenitidurans TaxID=2716335 RepID=A0ABX1EB49_9PROT|nr:hypothetical protein [Falsiroseomonas selenitidurans]NKC34460.1 hypothetical protein [Falsiroseomonas selenitidurans]
MRRLRALILLLPVLLFAPGCVVADVVPVGGYGYGYGYAKPYYAPPPPPRYYAPRPVYRPYYAPPPRYYAPPRHHGGWNRGHHHGHARGHDRGRHWR